MVGVLGDLVESFIDWLHSMNVQLEVNIQWGAVLLFYSYRESSLKIWTFMSYDVAFKNVE